MGTRWRGMLAPLGTSTGDGRRFLPAGFSHRELPLPLKWQRSDEAGHDTSVVVGLVDTIDLQDDAVWGEGEFFDDLDPRDFERLLADVHEAMLLTSKKTIGPSVDPGMAEAVLVRCGEDTPITEEELDELWWNEMETGEPAPIETLFIKYEMSGATLVPVPAFKECRPFELLETVTASALTAAVRSTGWDSMGFADREAAWDGSAAEKRIADDAGIGGDSPNWDQYAAAFLYVDSEADPETKGAYGFQIVDLVEGDYRIVPRAVFAVAGVLEGARGGTTISQDDQDKMKEVVGTLYSRMADEFDDPEIQAPWMSARVALVAAMNALTEQVTYDLSAFEAPEVDGLVSISVRDGQVFGHIATHDVCHVGIPGVCTTAPVDTSQFDRFHRYPLLASDGSLLAAGRITFGGGRFANACGCCKGSDDHACSSLSMGGAIAHHDQMTTVAYVRAYEDLTNNAIMVAGVLAPGVGEAEISALSRGKVSGDWRSVGGDLALVEILTLARERPGFPLPRARMASGQMMSLTAAGTVGPQRSITGTASQTPLIDLDLLAAKVADQLSARGIGTPATDPDLSTDHGTTGTTDNDQAEATTIVEEIGVIFAGHDTTEARRLMREVSDVLR
jgi:hypothetical protein